MNGSHYLQKYIPICSVDDCRRDHYAKALCKSHYAQVDTRRRGLVKKPLIFTKLPKKLIETMRHPKQISCSKIGCKNKHYAKTLCQNHYNVIRRHTITPPGRKCNIRGCKLLHLAKGLCGKHYSQLGYKEKQLTKEK